MIITLVTTHQTPDTDALAAAAALWWCLAPTEAAPVVAFDSAPRAEAHAPAQGRFIVDVGRGELDHHHHADPRSACAFGLVVEYIAHHGAPDQARRAMALRPLIPLVLRQDSTGKIVDDPDQQRTSLPAMLHRLVWAHQDDQAAWRDAWTILRMVFDAVGDRGEAPDSWMRQDRILRALDGDGNVPLAQFLGALEVQEQRAYATVMGDPQRVCTDYGVRLRGDVASYEVCLTAGAFHPGRYLRAAIAAAYPEVRMIVSVTRWHDTAGRRITVSRGVGRTRAGADLDCRALVATARAALPADDQELRSWYAERWFAGTGALTFPRPDDPPAGLVDRLAEVLHAPEGQG